MSRNPVSTAEAAASGVESAREWIRRHADYEDDAWETAWRRANAACRLPFDQGRPLPRPADSRRREREEARRALVAAVNGLRRNMRSATSAASVLEGDWREREWERERRDAPHEIAYRDVFVALRNTDSALQALVKAVGRPQLPGSTGFAVPAEKRRQGERASVQFEAWQFAGVRRAWEALEQPSKLGAGTAVVLSVALGLEGPIHDDWDQRLERWKKRLRGTKPRAF